MSKILFSNNGFLGKAELDRWQKFIETDGYKNFLIQHTDEFGLIRKENEPFVNGLVEEDLTLTVKIRELKAIDKNANLIYSKPISSLAIPADSTWYWIKVAYQTSIEETGTFSVDAFGNLTCTSGDAELTNILRGQPNYPSRISFTNATNNTLEYDVEEVIDDNNATLTGNFTSESDLKLAIVGTFTPGYNPSTGEKYIFKYDSCLITLVPLNSISPPSHTTGLEFIIGRAFNNGATIKVEDKRNEIWKVDSNYFLHQMDRLANPLVGVEQVTFDDSLSTQVENIVQFAWAFRANAFTVNTKLNSVTISAGEGGIFKSTNFSSLFNNGDFDGWRLYAASGNYYKIKTSSLVSSSIELILENLDSVDFFSNVDSTVSISQQLLVTPDVEEIEFICKADPGSSNKVVEKRIVFPVNTGYGRIRLNVYDDSDTLYNIYYRYKHLRDYSPELLLPEDTEGFYNESQFANNGNLIVTPTRTPYTPDVSLGYIPLQLSPGAYSNFVDKIDLGDLFGVQKRELDNTAPLIDLTVGSSRQYQYFGDQDNSVGNDQITLTADMFINLKKTNAAGGSCKNGNVFFIHIKQAILLSTFQFRIVTDYVNPTTYTLLKVLTYDDSLFFNVSEEGLFFRCSFDGTDWILNNVNESKFAFKRAEFRRGYISVPSVVSPGFNINNLSIYNPGFTLIPDFQIVLEPQTFTKKYLVTFKCSCATSGGTNNTGAQFMIFDTDNPGGNPLDFTSFEQQKSDTSDIINGTLVLNSIYYVAANAQATLEVQAKFLIGDLNVRDLVFTVTEIGI